MQLTPFHEERFVAAVPSAHRLAGLGRIHGAELAGDPFVFFPPAAGVLATARNLAPVVAGGAIPEVVQEASSWTTLLHLVAAGVGVTVAPVSALLAAPAGVVALELEGAVEPSILAWVSRADDTRPVLRAFVDAAP